MGLLSRKHALVDFKGPVRHISDNSPLPVFTVWNLGGWRHSAISSESFLLLLFLAIVILKKNLEIPSTPPSSLCIFFPNEALFCNLSSKAIHRSHLFVSR